MLESDNMMNLVLAEIVLRAGSELKRTKRLILRGLCRGSFTACQ